MRLISEIIRRRRPPFGPVFELGVGPSGMYVNEHVMRTDEDPTLQALLDRSLARRAEESQLPTDCLAALLAVPAREGRPH